MIDYDDEDPNNGYGDSFQPSVKASCVGGSMNIRVDTQLPFSGIIHTGNRSEPGCRYTIAAPWPLFAHSGWLPLVV